MNDAKTAVAVYWDFENIHASLLEYHEGPGEYSRRARFAQDVIVDLAPVVDLASTLGPIVVHRAYANWSQFSRYRSHLQTHAVDLIQLFQMSQGKNGADIRLALDILDDLHRHPHITDVVLAGGDSDFVAVAQKCRQLGRRIMGVGVEGSTGKYWPAACTTFRYYNDLLKAREPRTPDAPDTRQPDIQDAKVLLVRALQQLGRQSNDGWCTGASLGNMMLRLDPTFEVSRFGVRSMTAFLDMCADLVEVERRDHDIMVRLQGHTSVTSVAVDAPPEHLARVQLLKGALQNARITLPRRESLWAVVSHASAAFQDAGGAFRSWPEVDRALYRKTVVDAPAVTEDDCVRVRQLFYGLRLFTLFKGADSRDRRIGLEYGGGGALAEAVSRAIVQNVVRETEEPYVSEEIFYLLFGVTREDTKERWVSILRKMIEEAVASETAQSAVTDGVPVEGNVQRGDRGDANLVERGR